MMSKLTCAILLVVVIAGCRSSRPEPALFPETIPPNHCRVVGTVMAIDPSLSSAQPNDPCAKAPCRASIRIDEVVGYGAAFTPPLSKGDVIEVQFAFTTGDTRSIFPDLAQHFPGVTTGTKVKADLQSNDARKGSESGRNIFTIFFYQVQPSSTEAK
jgi:hypothetical protein